MNNQVVCIVGKPNVGKSTLFNKIVGERISITEDTPGVTRDRIYGIGNWLGREFSIIDTGGLDTRAQDDFMDNIRLQADIAIDAADTILFVVDGVTSVTSSDRDLAQILRQTKKKILLVVNKFDSKKTYENRYDFYELGLGEPFYVSAEQGQGIGDLLDAVIEGQPVEEEGQDEDRVRVSFIGKPNVGKSSLINYILGENRNIVTNVPGTTRDSIDSYYHYEGTDYVFVDTAGLRKRKKIEEKVERYSAVRTLSSIDRSHICVLLIDAKEGVSEQDAKIVGYAHDRHKGIIIAVNKWDAVEKDNNSIRKYEKAIRERLPFMNYAPLIFISAKTGKRVQDLLQLINLVNNNYSLRIPTGVLNDLLNQAVLMKQPPSDKGKRGKLYYGSQVATRPPKFTMYVNDKDLFHFSYRRYLENQIRQAFSFDGVPLRFSYKERGEED